MSRSHEKYFLSKPLSKLDKKSQKQNYKKSKNCPPPPPKKKKKKKRLELIPAVPKASPPLAFAVVVCCIIQEQFLSGDTCRYYSLGWLAGLVAFGTFGWVIQRTLQLFREKRIFLDHTKVGWV